MSRAVPGFPAGYRPLARLGRGGAGEVWKARAPGGRLVALKRPPPGAGEDVRSRLRREFLNLGRLRDSAFPEAIAWIDGAQPAYAMTLVEGPDLRAALGPPRRGAAERERLRAVRRRLAELLEALARLHAESLVHRDLKPENLRIGADGRLRILDFSLALPRASAGEGSERLRAAGTLHYLAPEVIEGRPADARADLYSVGALAFELATGRAPYIGSPAKVLAAHLDRQPPDPRERNPAVDAPFAEWMLGLLAKSPDRRPPGALHAREALIGRRTRTRAAVSSNAPYVGNRAALRTVLDAADALREGRGGFLWIQGEPGAGKSRLLAELAGRAAALGLPCLTGHAREAGGAAGQLFIEPLLREPDRLPKRLPARWRILAPLLPRDAVDDASAGRPDPAARGRALGEMLSALAGRRTVLLLLEDLHWADEVSLRLLAELLRHPPPGFRALIVASSRERPPVLPLAAPAPRRLPLRRLSSAETSRLARLLAPDGRAPSPAKLRRLHSASGGNPFHVTELLRAGVISNVRGAGVDLRAALQRRLLPFDREERAALGAAALLGGDFTPAQWAATAGLPEGRFASLFDEARREGLVIATRDALRFPHDLVRAHLAAGVPRAAARAAHRRAFRALSADNRARAVEPGRIALHARAAGLGAHAVEWGLNASRRAESSYQYRALEHWLDWVAGVATSPARMAPRQRLRWLYFRLFSMRMNGSTTEVLARLPAALALARRLGEKRTEGRLEQIWSNVLRARNDFRAALVRNRRAIRLLAPRDPGGWRLARLTVSECLYRTGRSAEGIRVLHGSLLEARRSGDWLIAGAAANMLGHAHLLRGEVREAGRWIRAALSITLRHHPSDVARAAIYRGNIAAALLETGRSGAARRLLAGLLNNPEAMRSRHLLTDVRVLMAEVEMTLGRRGAARRLLASAAALATRHGYREYRGHIAVLRAELALREGARADARQLLARAEAEFAALGLPDDRLRTLQRAVMLTLRDDPRAAADFAARLSRLHAGGLPPSDRSLNAVLVALARRPAPDASVRRRARAVARRLAAAGRVRTARRLLALAGR